MPALRTRDTQPRSLEVTTDVLQPPSFAIISPTPRAFTFPITTSFADSPYSSPSHSPFEPSLCSLSLSSCTTPPPFGPRTLTPDSAFTSASPSPSSHRRRKSSTNSDIVDRRPRKGDEDYIKRPENAFILFRRKCCEERQAAQEEASTEGTAKKQRQADLSKTISQQWKGLSTDERQYWEHLAKEKKKEHEQLYPNYVYRPQRAKDKDGRSKSRKPKGRRGDLDDTDGENFSFVVHQQQQQPHRHHGRSASAPTPPPYQAIQVPNVYQMNSSCPTSPSLIPMISRRSAGSEDPLSTFDFQPSENFVQQGSYMPFGGDSEPSEFMRTLFEYSQKEQLHPLDISHETLLLPPHQINSPSSTEYGSSGPSTPNSGPYTPDSSVLSQPFGASEPSQAELMMQLQTEYAQYSWETNQMWPTSTSEQLFCGDDFDLTSIPPIELGMPKYQSDSAHLGEYIPEPFPNSMEIHPFPEDGALDFDEMMASHGF